MVFSVTGFRIILLKEKLCTFEKIIRLSFNYDNTHGGNNGFIYQNQLPEKLIEQYEERIKELKEQVDYWKSRSQGIK